jgi:hypothetical protein
MDILEAFSSLIMIALMGFIFGKLGILVRNRLLFWYRES